MTPQERKNFEWVRDNMHSEMPQEDVIKLATKAGLCSASNGFIDWIDSGPSLHEMKLFAKLVVEKEREACAKIADEWAVGWPHPSTVIAERIRARGQS